MNHPPTLVKLGERPSKTIVSLEILRYFLILLASDLVYVSVMTGIVRFPADA